ncbi:uncharacterized protein LOC115319625 isoform X1 [Ixodes scapularis]|uniref:uncharacterized protein LOC115319625 isoform X1 n=2 Tax=Ixodes scapularis TaxID=6945 RepID=UPI001A9D9014|nr:uncharacterized protein LOC115319625 isoform X1 [Ixodes scapularis]
MKEDRPLASVSIGEGVSPHRVEKEHIKAMHSTCHTILGLACMFMNTKDFLKGLHSNEQGPCEALPTFLHELNVPWNAEGGADDVLDEATMIKLCSQSPKSDKSTLLATQVENSCSIECTTGKSGVYHVNITDGLTCGIEKVCIRTECRRRPSITESDMCKALHPRAAARASGYDECQFLCYLQNQDMPRRYCRPAGTACSKNSGSTGTCNLLGYCMTDV